MHKTNCGLAGAIKELEAIAAKIMTPEEIKKIKKGGDKMTYQDYIKEVKRAQQIKKTIRTCVAATALVAVLGGLGYASGYNRGHLAGLYQGADAVAECTEQGATGWMISAEGVRCLYD